MTSVYPALISNGQSIHGVTFNQPWWVIYNTDSTNTLFLIDDDGDMYLDADTITVATIITGSFTNSLIIQDATDELFVLNAAHAYFSGKVYTNHSSLPAMDGDDLEIRDVGGNPIAVFDGDDNSLYLKGDATHEATTVVPRKVLDFDGVDDYVDLPDFNVDWSGGLTIEAWVKWDALKNYARVFNLGNGEQNRNIALREQSTNTNFGYTVHNDATPGTWDNNQCDALIVIGTWTHIAVTHDVAGVVTFYKNGTECLSSSTGYALPVTINRTLNYIGRSSLAADDYFDGKIDEMRVWQGVRSAAEIFANMYTTYATLTTSDSIIAYWDFNHILGSQVVDATGTYHGRIVNGASSDNWIAEQTTHTLTVQTGLNGVASPSGAQVVGENVDFPIDATPTNTSFAFSGWTETVNAGNVTIANSGNFVTTASAIGTATIQSNFVAAPLKGLAFDGVDEYVSLPSFTLDVSSGFTIELWVMWNSAAGWVNEPVIDLGQGAFNDNILFTRKDGTNQVYFQMFNGASSDELYSSSNFVVEDVWTHVAITVTSAGVVTLYKNAIFDATGSVAMTGDDLERSSNFIASNNFGSGLFNGIVDGFRVWDDVRSTSEIHDNRLFALDDSQANLLLSYNFNQTMGTYLRDHGPDENHGTITNMEDADWTVEPTTRAITIAAGSNGSVLRTGGHTVFDGEHIALSATPDGGYYFDKWVTTVTGGTQVWGDSTADSTFVGTSGASITVQAQFLQGNNALDFDGTDDYVDMFDVNFTWTGGFTIEAWVNYDTNPLDMGMVSFSNTFDTVDDIVIVGPPNDDATGWRLAIANGTSGTNWTGASVPSVLATGQWTHFALVVAADKSATIYKNGQIAGTATTAEMPLDENRIHSFIGRGNWTGNPYFDGKMDDLRIWKDARTQAEIMDNMFVELAGTEDNLVTSYNFDEGTGTTLTDIKAANTGTLINMDNTDWVTSFTRLNVTVNNDGNGTITPSGTQETYGNVLQNITASGNSGYIFSTWEKVSGTGTVTFTNASAASTTYKVTGGDAIIRATFIDGYSAWTDSSTIAINTATASVTTTQVDFPLLIRLTSTNMPTSTFFSSETEAGGADIRFAKVSDPSVSFPYEIVDWDAGAETAEIWVLLDSALGNTDGDYVRMYWGKSGATTESDGETVFDASSGYAAVWHLQDDTDATSNNNDLTNVNNPTTTACLIGDCKDMNGSNQYAWAADDANLNLNSTFTVSGWAKWESGGTPAAYGRIINKKFTWDAGNGWELAIVSGDNDQVQMMGIGGEIMGGDNAVNWSSSSWQYITGVWNGTTYTIYANGTSINSGTLNAMVNSTTAVHIGSRSANDYWNGKLDEMQMYDGARSADWVKLSYESQKSGSTLIDIEKGFDAGIVTNGQFGSDLSGWQTTARSGGAQVATQSNGVCSVYVSNTGGSGERWHNNIQQEYDGATELKASTNYTVSFKAKSDKSISLHSKIYGSATSVTEPVAQMTTNNYTLTTSWQTFSYTWNNGAAYDYKYHMIAFGGVDQPAAPYYVLIDDVSIVEQ